MKEKIEFITRSCEETMELAESFAGMMAGGDLIALIGELGAGKTVFVKGLAKGLGVDGYNYVNSPSFVAVKEYDGKVPLYHFDVYRFCGRLFNETIDYERYFYAQGVTAVEWADNISDILPDEYIEVTICYGKDDERIVSFRAVGERPENIIEKFISARRSA
ncbi:MAG: tRNA (adenosine(37)-N6)-threonylcarbamoyltransferase complex ATPase subunit type 1 TsaE [Candidatus Omnitrophota bacterium]